MNSSSTPARAQAPDDAALGPAIWLILCLIAALVATIATAASRDALFQFEGYIFIAAFVLGSFGLLAVITRGGFPAQPQQPQAPAGPGGAPSPAGPGGFDWTGAAPNSQALFAQLTGQPQG